MTIAALKGELKSLAEPHRAEVSLRFFQTQQGGFGEDDQFFCVTVPDQRKVAEQFEFLKLPDFETLLQVLFNCSIADFGLNLHEFGI